MMDGRWVGLAGVGAIAAGMALLAANWSQLTGAEAPAPAAAPAASAAQGIVIPTDAPELAAAGAPLYAEACAACHGADLQGAPNWRAPLADGTYPAPPHDASGHTWHHGDGFLFAYTKLGGQAFMPAGQKSGMPGFEDQLTDQEILAILTYIKSKWPAEIQARQARIAPGG